MRGKPWPPTVKLVSSARAQDIGDVLEGVLEHPGFAAGEIPSVKANYLLVKNISVSGLQWSDYRDRTPQRIDEVQADIFRLWKQGSVRPHLMKEFAFDELPIALQLIGEGKVRGKAVVIVSSQ